MCVHALLSTLFGSHAPGGDSPSIIERKRVSIFSGRVGCRVKLCRRASFFRTAVYTVSLLSARACEGIETSKRLSPRLPTRSRNYCERERKREIVSRVCRPYTFVCESQNASFANDCFVRIRWVMCWKRAKMGEAFPLCAKRKSGVDLTAASKYLTEIHRKRYIMLGSVIRPTECDYSHRSHNDISGGGIPWDALFRLVSRRAKRWTMFVADSQSRRV